MFGEFGIVDGAKKVKDFGFIDFKERESALKVSNEFFCINLAHMLYFLFVGDRDLEWERIIWRYCRIVVSEAPIGKGISKAAYVPRWK